MPKNYQEKYKAHLDGVLRDRVNPSKKQEAAQSKLGILKRFACTLDLEDKPDNADKSK